MDIITGYLGEAHITAEQDRDINIGIVGDGSYVMPAGQRLAAEVSSNNEVRIRDGVIMHQGCAASIKKNTYDPVTIINGSQGMKRIDLIVARYERNVETGVETISLVALQGTPAEESPEVPEHTEGDIQSGDTVVDMPLYKVQIDGLNITGLEKVFEEIESLKALNGKLPAGYIRVNIGALPNNTVKSTPANIPAQATEYWIERAWCRSRSTGQVNPIPYINPGTWDDTIGISISAGGNVAVTTTANWSAYDGYVVIGYTIGYGITI